MATCVVAWALLGGCYYSVFFVVESASLGGCVFLGGC